MQQIPFPDLAAANAAYQKIQSGTDFVALAKDKDLSEADIDLGTVARTDLADPAIAEAAFKLDANKVSEPVTGKLGNVVLLRVTGIEPGKTPDLRRGRSPSSRKSCSRSAPSGAIFDLHDKIEDQLASGSTLSEVAGKLKLDYQLIDQVDREGRKPDGSTRHAAGAEGSAERGVRHRYRGRERSDRRQGRWRHLV